ncbi:CAIB/BAIF family protein [Vibrio astriarenae]|nr:CAIB/BAIF family protein [Vibrio sp. C7]
MKPLEGMTVVSIEQALAAPLCTARLAEAGARVIKVERKEGDFARGYDSAAFGSSSYFTWTNQGKESVVLDFRQERDAKLLEALISKADVFIQNLAPGAMKRAGFGSARLREDYPSLVTVDITGYGEDEAVKHLKAYDFLIQAESGLTGISGGKNEMGRIGVSICDIGAGMTAHAAVMEALMLRTRTQSGAAIAISLFDVAADWMSVPLIHGIYGKGPLNVSGCATLAWPIWCLSN